MYFDEAGIRHPIYTAEVYLPWNNTWQLLPSLPSWTYDGVQYNMTDTKIVSSNTVTGDYKLHLVGGTHFDYNTDYTDYTRAVWVLNYNGSHHYWYQDSDMYPDMGK